MIKKSARRKAIAIGSAVAASLTMALATSSAASADPMRTFNLAMLCQTGEAYGLLVSTNGSFFYAPNGSSTVSGNVKYFTVSIPASTTTLAVAPLSCANQPPGSNPSAYHDIATITAGTSNVNASTNCADYSFDGILLYDCHLTSITYG
jgi:hypothetical protein